MIKSQWTQQPVYKLPQPKPTPAPAEPVEVHSKKIDEENFSWLDLGKGVTGSVLAGGIEGVGGLVAGAVKSPRVTYEAIKGTWKSKMLGPILKTTITPVLLVAGLATPALTALAGLGYGMFEGFVKGAEENPLAAGQQAVETVKKMHGSFSKEVVRAIQEAATKEPEKPEDVYEINLVEAGQGLLGAAAGASIDGLGVAGTVAWHVPSLYSRVSQEIWKSDSALPLKVGGQFLASGAAVIAVPLGAVAGTLYGMGTGAYDGYQKGVGASVKEAVEDVQELHKALDKLTRD
jgi:hypothetical protein